jgi:hypothetical protein
LEYQVWLAIWNQPNAPGLPRQCRIQDGPQFLHLNNPPWSTHCAGVWVSDKLQKLLEFFRIDLMLFKNIRYLHLEQNIHLGLNFMSKVNQTDHQQAIY